MRAHYNSIQVFRDKYECTAKKSLPLKIIKSNGAVPRLKKHVLKTEVIASLDGSIIKGDRVHGLDTSIQTPPVL